MAKTETNYFATPEGRLINNSLFERDIFKDARGNEGKPRYNVELAFDPDQVQGEAEAGKPLTLEDQLFNYAEDKWGEGAGQDFLDGKIRSPLLSGDRQAEKREKRGKPGDAYKGKIIVRAHTLFNKHGEEAPGGIQIWDEDIAQMEDVDAKEKCYNGSYGAARLSIGDYEDTDADDEARNCLMFYLSSYQYRGEGERLVSPQDTSDAFEPVGRKKGEASKRRTRKG